MPYHARTVDRTTGAGRRVAVDDFRHRLVNALRLPLQPLRETLAGRRAQALPTKLVSWTALLAYAALKSLGSSGRSQSIRAQRDSAASTSSSGVSRSRTSSPRAGAAGNVALGLGGARGRVHHATPAGRGCPAVPLREWLDDPDVAWALGVQRGTTACAIWSGTLRAPAGLDGPARSARRRRRVARRRRDRGIAQDRRGARERRRARAGYRIDDLLALTTEPGRRR